MFLNILKLYLLNIYIHLKHCVAYVSNISLVRDSYYYIISLTAMCVLFLTLYTKVKFQVNEPLSLCCFYIRARYLNPRLKCLRMLFCTGPQWRLFS